MDNTTDNAEVATVIEVRRPLPWHDRIVVEGKEAESDSSLIDTKGTEKGKEPPIEGEVLYVGPGALVDGTPRPIPCKRGDKVLFGKYAGVRVTFDRQQYIILREAEILATIETIKIPIPAAELEVQEAE